MACESVREAARARMSMRLVRVCRFSLAAGRSWLAFASFFLCGWRLLTDAGVGGEWALVAVGRTLALTMEVRVMLYADACSYCGVLACCERVCSRCVGLWYRASLFDCGCAAVGAAVGGILSLGRRPLS